MSEQHFRAHALLIRAGKVLLHRVPDRGDVWEIPGGSVAPDETPAEVARREVTAETGLDVLVADELTHFVDSAGDTHTITFGCFENEVHPEADPTPADFQWMSYEQATHLPLAWHVRKTLEHADALGMLS
ncbi:NUDIX hydrolase [Nocardia puris]|uniref:ADP-ribose pyrophosphatase YjhB (NUDIX family) n=1 Tax=Nocardia puris TaxID=208602 RepID=A0A366DNY8_9NOCA|nr:NUDIX hydrolase [Nocardia puris]MBF6214242.1 NUDIX hydrolase [Nocardia puris]MBF6365268.1 NUDIX hydrolase [Nocardia puris]MBF6459670.1 NUDIX hydrolase [Nocardia puris]RBO91786.1 ADP-ribose pyrophosphatase YjhB (NUDIX family) [Nocardia puris]